MPEFYVVWVWLDFILTPEGNNSRIKINKMPLMAFHGMLNVASFIRIVCFGDF